MSTWYEPKKEDLSISKDGKELHIYIDSDYSGAIRVSVNMSDVLEAYCNHAKAELKFLGDIEDCIDNPKK